MSICPEDIFRKELTILGRFSSTSLIISRLCHGDDDDHQDHHNNDTTLPPSLINPHTYSRAVQLAATLGPRYLDYETWLKDDHGDNDDNGDVIQSSHTFWAILPFLTFSFSRLGVAVFPLEKYEDAIHQLRTGAIAKAVFDLSLWNWVQWSSGSSGPVGQVVKWGLNSLRNIHRPI